MFFYKDKAFEQGIEYIFESLNKMKEEYHSLKSSLIPDGTRIQPIKSCLIVGSTRYANINSYETKNCRWGTNSLEQTIKEAYNEYNEILNKVEQIHKENILNLEINNKIFNYVCMIFKNLGISETYITYEYTSTRSTKKVERTHTAGYLLDLNRYCKTDDGYNQALKELERFKQDIEQYKVNKENQIKTEQYRKEQELLKQKQIKDAIIILDKYKKVIGVDYSLETAIELSEELQMNEEELFSKYALNIIRNEFNGVEIIETNLVGEWRHGVNKEIIIQSNITKKFYKCFYQDSPKDNMSLEDMNPFLEFEELPNFKK